jgi:hypothetical protein
MQLQFVDRGCHRSADDIQRHRLMRVAAEQQRTLKVEVSCVEGISQCRGRLGRPLESEHPLVPGNTSKPVGFLPSFGSALRRMSDRTAVVCTDNLNAGVAVMKSAQDGA